MKRAKKLGPWRVHAYVSDGGTLGPFVWQVDATRAAKLTRNGFKPRLVRVTIVRSKSKRRKQR